MEDWAPGSRKRDSFLSASGHCVCREPTMNLFFYTFHWLVIRPQLIFLTKETEKNKLFYLDIILQRLWWSWFEFCCTQNYFLFWENLIFDLKMNRDSEIICRVWLFVFQDNYAHVVIKLFLLLIPVLIVLARVLGIRHA